MEWHVLVGLVEPSRQAIPETGSRHCKQQAFSRPVIAARQPAKLHLVVQQDYRRSATAKMKSFIGNRNTALSKNRWKIERQLYWRPSVKQVQIFRSCHCECASNACAISNIVYSRGWVRPSTITPFTNHRRDQCHVYFGDQAAEGIAG